MQVLCPPGSSTHCNSCAPLPRLDHVQEFKPCKGDAGLALRPSFRCSAPAFMLFVSRAFEDDYITVASSSIRCCSAIQLRPGHNLGICKPMGHPCQERICGQTTYQRKYSRRSPMLTLPRVPKSRPRSSCANLSSHLWCRSCGRG